jgi:nucleoside phosphorylase
MSADEMNAIVEASLWHRFQMPAYHLERSDREGGVTLVNIGVGPSNAKTITDHLAVLRPHCWLMVGHCGGLRQSQRIGDYVLAHGYLRQDHILDSLVPPDIPIPALAEVQVALQQAAYKVTGESGEALKQRLRTGTVMTNDDRNWELRWSQERKRINLSRAIAVDMESGTLAAQGYRLRVPYGTLLCVSDKPLHGEIKLPGAASAFYRRAVGEHLNIGLVALDILRGQLGALHSRKLRKIYGTPYFSEGWALYGEEMLSREGLYPENSVAQAQVLRLSRYRAARIGVDVNLHTGKWTFDQAVNYFMEAGGLDREAATGEAAGAAASPTQKITYMVGKWQIMRLLGKYRDKQGANFRLGQFHDDLLRNGSLPLSLVEWMLLDDSSSLDQALK